MDGRVGAGADWRVDAGADGADGARGRERADQRAPERASDIERAPLEAGSHLTGHTAEHDDPPAEIEQTENAERQGVPYEVAYETAVVLSKAVAHRGLRCR